MIKDFRREVVKLALTKLLNHQPKVYHRVMLQLLKFRKPAKIATGFLEEDGSVSPIDKYLRKIFDRDD